MRFLWARVTIGSEVKMGVGKGAPRLSEQSMGPRSPGQLTSSPQKVCDEACCLLAHPARVRYGMNDALRMSRDWLAPTRRESATGSESGLARAPLHRDRLFRVDRSLPYRPIASPSSERPGHPARNLRRAGLKRAPAFRPFLYGVRLSVEGSVVGLLVLDGWDVAQARGRRGAQQHR